MLRSLLANLSMLGALAGCTVPIPPAMTPVVSQLDPDCTYAHWEDAGDDIPTAVAELANTDTWVFALASDSFDEAIVGPTVTLESSRVLTVETLVVDTPAPECPIEQQFRVHGKGIPFAADHLSGNAALELNLEPATGRTFRTFEGSDSLKADDDLMEIGEAQFTENGDSTRGLKPLGLRCRLGGSLFRAGYSIGFANRVGVSAGGDTGACALTRPTLPSGPAP